MAAHSFNLGLRSYYFALAMLSWFINPWVFMAITAGVVYVLYRREFKSEVLGELVATPAHFPEPPPEEAAEIGRAGCAGDNTGRDSGRGCRAIQHDVGSSA